jgi:ribonucleoside-triphosphate reductase
MERKYETMVTHNDMIITLKRISKSINDRIRRKLSPARFERIELQLYPPFVKTINALAKKYGDDFTRLNTLSKEQLNFTTFIDNFIDSNNVANASIDPNANVKAKDICSLENEMSKPHLKLLAYNKIFYELTKHYDLAFARKWLEEEWSGASYLHDSYSSTFKPYCFAYDLEDLVQKGLFFVDGFGGGAPKHLTTFVAHCKEFVSWTSNRTSGACGLPSFLVHAFYFWKHDKETNFCFCTANPEYYRDQCFQEFIYGLNQPYLRIAQCAFTNISIMDRPYLTEIFGGREYPDGTFVVDYIDEIIEFQKAFMRVVSQIRQETMFTFPVLTYSLLYQDGFVDEEFARWCSDHNTEWCDSNFFVSGDVTSLSSCCRLVNDFSKLDSFINSIGGTSLKIGSVKVDTMNLMRIAYESNGDRDKYFEILEDRTHTIIKTLDVIRHIIYRNIQKGLLPNYSSGLIDLKNQYNTIGINAMYEAVRYFGGVATDELGYEYYTDDGLQFAIDIMDKINEIKDSYDFDYSINVEAVPAERCAVVLCQKDSLLYENKYNDFIYANQWIPLTQKCTLDEKIRLGSILDKKCGGGQISHINLSSPFASKDQAWDMLNYIANKGVIYFAFNNKISVCENNHGFIAIGPDAVCPKCGKPAVDTYQRIVGYLVPSANYSKDRYKEFINRYWYDVDDGLV